MGHLRQNTLFKRKNNNLLAQIKFWNVMAYISIRYYFGHFLRKWFKQGPIFLYFQYLNISSVDHDPPQLTITHPQLTNTPPTSWPPPPSQLAITPPPQLTHQLTTTLLYTAPNSFLVGFNGPPQTKYANLT